MENFCYQLHLKQIQLFDSMVYLRFNLANANMAMVPFAAFIKRHMELFRSSTSPKARREPEAVCNVSSFEWLLDAGQEQVLYNMLQPPVQVCP